jgi:AcrR family transcriptional regulator
VGDPQATDGRKARGVRNRDAIVAAARELFEEGIVDPRPAEIAERCGVSWRSVYRHFPDRADLVHAVALSATDRLASLLDTTPPEPTLEARISAFITARLAAVREFSPLMAATAAAIANTTRHDRPSPLRKHQLAVRALVLEVSLRHFADDLERLEPARRHAAELLLEMLLIPDWFMDRHEQGISETKTATTAETLLRIALEP